jgi:hypothetical protein
MSPHTEQTMWYEGISEQTTSVALVECPSEEYKGASRDEVYRQHARRIF